MLVPIFIYNYTIITAVTHSFLINLDPDIGVVFHSYCKSHARKVSVPFLRHIVMCKIWYIKKRKLYVIIIILEFYTNAFMTNSSLVI